MIKYQPIKTKDMKKLLFTLLAAVLLLPAFAQTEVAYHPISQHVTAVDLNGQTISSEAILSSGKAMVVCYSATWCGYCWAMHSNGILDAIQTQLGDQVQAVWVEADPSTSSASIYGGSGSQGNWTQYQNKPVCYPIVDNPSFANLIGGTNAIDGFPTVVFVSPTGYWCDVYGTSWGFGYSNPTQAVNAVTALLSNYPVSGEAPRCVSINCSGMAFANESVDFISEYVSVDPVEVTWSFTGGTPDTGSGDQASTVYNTTGSYTVSMTVQNASGSVTKSKTMLVRDNFGAEMDYTFGNPYVSSVGLGSGGTGEAYWGVKYPVSQMANRDKLTNVSIYSHVAGQYRLLIYQGGESAPVEPFVYAKYYTITETDQWVDCPIDGDLQLDPTKNLWIVFRCSGAAFPMSYCAYCGSPDSHLVRYNGTWYEVSDLSSSLANSTWMIKATTTFIEPVPGLDFEIVGPTEGIIGQEITYTIDGPVDAVYDWALENAVPPVTLNSNTATAVWNELGEFTITVDGHRNEEQVTKSITVTIIENPDGVQELGAKGVAVYPSPATDRLFVKAEGIQKISISDLNGSVLMTAQTNEIDISQLSSGIYIVNVVTDKGLAIKRVVKQ